MKIDKIFISCSKKDFYFARICIASVRYWYPEIPIHLLIDQAWGKVNTSYLEENWNVKIHSTEISVFKESYIKLEPLFAEKKTRILNIDGDLVFVGKLLDELEKYDEDFIVETVPMDTLDAPLKNWWFDYTKLKKFDPDYIYPGYVFYAGQYVINTSALSRSDFEPLITFTEPPKMKYPEIFQQGYDQGILNYVVSKKKQNGELSFRHYPFMITQFEQEKIKAIRLNDIINKKGIPQLIHWNGPKLGITSFIPASGILHFYEKYYFSMSRFPMLNFYTANISRNFTHPFVFTKNLIKKIIGRD